MSYNGQWQGYMKMLATQKSEFCNILKILRSHQTLFSSVGNEECSLSITSLSLLQILWKRKDECQTKIQEDKDVERDEAIKNEVVTPQNVEEIRFNRPKKV